MHSVAASSIISPYGHGKRGDINLSFSCSSLYVAFCRLPSAVSARRTILAELSFRLPTPRCRVVCRRCFASAAYVVMRCVSVCVSVTFVHSVKTNKHMFKIFHHRVCHSILVFPYQTTQQYSDGNPLNGGVECRWGRQKSRF